MVPKRKSGKRRSNGNGLVKGILIGLAVVGGIGGLGFVGYLFYNKAILPALAEQKAQKLHQESNVPDGKAAAPPGWVWYRKGNFVMLMPKNSKTVMRDENGYLAAARYEGSRDGVSIEIAQVIVTPRLGIGGGATLFDTFLPENNPGIFEIKNVRQLEGVPRCREITALHRGDDSVVRFYEDSPTQLLMIVLIGNPNNARVQEVMRSMSYQ